MHHRPARSPRRPQSGLTLVECLVALAVSAVVAGTTVPGFQAAMEQRRLDGAAAQLETDLALARAAAVAAHRSLRLSLQSQADGSCYVVHSGAADACTCSATALPVCAGTAMVLRSEQFPAGGPVQVAANVRSMVLDPDTGTVSPTGTLRLVGRQGRAVHLVVNIRGRVRQCTPTPPLAGHAAC